MWRCKLRENYDNKEQWIAYAEAYGLHTRLGYKTPEIAWNANPFIQGSANPADFKRIKSLRKAEQTAVVFRMFHGEVIALFPELLGTNDPLTCSSYMHMGQHSSANELGVLRESRPATPAEYRSLKRELESAPYRYKFRVLHRVSRAYYAMRQAECSKPPPPADKIIIPAC